MAVTIPFSILPPNLLRALSNHLMGIGRVVEKLLPNLQIELERVDFKVEAKRYVAMCAAATIVGFIILSTISAFLFSFYGILAALLISFFIFMMQLKYPGVRGYKRVRKLDADLHHKDEEADDQCC